MSSFGCKGPLRYAIVTEDNWFDTAEEMVEYLINRFKDDKSKSFHTIDPCDNAKQREAKQREKKKGKVKIGCRKMHMIAVSSNGTFINRTILNSSDSKLLELNLFDATDDEEFPLALQMLGRQDEIVDNDDIIDTDVVFSVIIPGTFVAF